MKFIRVHGRVIPIKDKGEKTKQAPTSEQKKVGKRLGAVGAAVGISGALVGSLAGKWKIGLPLLVAGVGAQEAGLRVMAHGVKRKRTAQESKSISRETGLDSLAVKVNAGAGLLLGAVPGIGNEAIGAAQRAGVKGYRNIITTAAKSKSLKGAIVAGIGGAILGSALNIGSNLSRVNRASKDKKGDPESAVASSNAGYKSLAALAGGAAASFFGYKGVLGAGKALKPYTSKFSDWRRFKNATNVGRG